MLEVLNKKFYILDTSDKTWLAQSEEEAIGKLKEVAKDLENPDNVGIFSVDISKEKWEIVQVPWAKIVLKVLGAD